MQPIATALTAARPTPLAAPAPGAPGVSPAGISQQFVAAVLRGSGAGIAAATSSAGLQADKGAIYPVESIYMAVDLLAKKTKSVPVVGGVTKFLPTVAGFALLIAASQTSAMIRSTGATAMDLTHVAADMIDGQKTHKGWSIGWGIATADAAGNQSAVGSALDALGVARTK